MAEGNRLCEISVAMFFLLEKKERGTRPLSLVDVSVLKKKTSRILFFEPDL
jgi:hypothetical protein